MKFKLNKQRSFYRLLSLIIQFKMLIFFSIICMGGYNIFTAAPAFYAKDIVDALAYGESPKLRQFFFVGFGIILVFTLKGLFFFGHNYTMGVIIQRLIARLRQKVFDHLINLSLSYFAKSKTGDLISRFTNDLHVLQVTLNVGVTGPFRDIPQIFILFGIMVYRSWQLALATTVIIPIALFFIHIFGRRNKWAVTDRQASFGDLSSLLMETISGIRIMKAFGMEKYESERFGHANNVLYNNHMRSILIASYSTPIIEVIGATAGATIVAYGGFLIINNQITAGDFASFFISFFMMNEPVKKINGFNLKLQEGLAAIRRVFAILDTQPEVSEAEDAKKLDGFEDHIKIDIKTFQYAGTDHPALSDIQLTVDKGEAIALVGSSGAGKTSLVNLIPRFFDLTDGNITIDGYDIRELQIKSLRSLMSIVTQETILFNDTVANNITYGHPECPEEKLIAAAKAANAHQFILNLKDGYNTIIGEKGVKLSGGQRQRLAIARALIKDAPILILDEATSALDTESEMEVQQAIEHLMENRTTIVIAHRLSTIRNVNRICVMENGRIVETGPHNVLIENGGRYKDLYTMQFKDQLESLAT